MVPHVVQAGSHIQHVFVFPGNFHSFCRIVVHLFPVQAEVESGKLPADPVADRIMLRMLKGMLQTVGIGGLGIHLLDNQE